VDSGEGATSVKDFRRPDVNEPDVEDTDAPVITRGVGASRVAPAVSTLGSIVEAAFDAHAPQLKAFALAAVRDEDAADDLVQETFIRFVRQVRSNSVPDNVGGWLHRVCANLITSQGRRRSVVNRKKPILVDRTVAESAEDRVIRMDEAARLRDALGQLPVDARVALLMAAAGFSPAEIGQAVGRSTNATSTYICRARVRLREILAPSKEAEP
jgi:RNA polymerase sigma-70 factor (ECF subfamily)